LTGSLWDAPAAVPNQFLRVKTLSDFMFWASHGCIQCVIYLPECVVEISVHHANRWGMVLGQNFSRSSLNIVSVYRYHPLPRALLEHLCHRPTSLIGVALDCVVPACASAQSSLWSTQLGCLMLLNHLVLRNGYLVACALSSGCCVVTSLGGYIAAEVALLLWILCCEVSGRCFAAMLLVV
jgi:hypothetical protein